MSTFRRLTLIGLYNHNAELFDLLTLPAAYDRDTFIDSLLLDHGEKCVVYPDFDFCKYAIGVWSRKWARALERIAIALTEEYNPLHNYDRYEEISEHEEGDYKNKVQTDGTKTNAGNTSETENTSNMATEKAVSAFNESSYQPTEKSTVNGNITRTGNSTNTDTQKTTEDGTGDDRRDKTHSAHMYGNIGVTTSVQMLTAEVDARQRYNMYAVAGQLFADDLLLMLY